MRRILDGIRVLDLTRVLAGPWATQNLADLGAEVIKIERPGQGDDTRTWGPPFLKDRDGNDTPDAAYFLAANRGKKSVTLDIASVEGRELAKRLARDSDVVVENFKVGDLARYGLDYASLRIDHPGLIYCSITGFGQDGPYRDRPGYDFMIQGLGGLMSVTGERDDLPGGGPQKVGVAVADLFTGLYATNAILAALLHRDRSGEGQYIDIALLDVQVAMLANLGAACLASGHAPGRMGNAHQAIVPYQVFRAADGFLIVAVGNDTQFARFCEVAGLQGLAADPRYARNPQRVANREELVATIAARLATRPAGEWLRRARGGAGAVRADQRPGPGVCRSAGAPSRHGRHAAALRGGRGPRGGQPRQVLRDAGSPRAAAAAPGRAYRRRAGRAPRAEWSRTECPAQPQGHLNRRRRGFSAPAGAPVYSRIRLEPCSVPSIAGRSRGEVPIETD